MNVFNHGLHLSEIVVSLETNLDANRHRTKQIKSAVETIGTRIKLLDSYIDDLANDPLLDEFPEHEKNRLLKLLQPTGSY